MTLTVAIGSVAAVAQAQGHDVAAVSAAREHIARHGKDLRVANDEEHDVRDTIRDPTGAQHVRFARKYRGLRVHGGDFVVHMDRSGEYARASSGLSEPLTLPTAPGVSAATAAAQARKRFQGSITTVDAGELIVDATSGRGRLAWEHTIVGWGPDGQTPSRLHVLTDARTGAHISSWDEIVQVLGSGRTLYAGTVSVDTTSTSSGFSMTDPSHGSNTACDMNNGTSGCTLFQRATNVWGNGATSSRETAAADAYYGAALTFDYYNAVHGRSGVFGDGRGVPSRVHYGSAYANAFWDGSQMTYGDGSGNTRPLTSIDVAAHEMTHGVTASTANLVYSGESGGLNEATSDIFACMVEFYAGNGSDAGDYLIGEKINIHGNGTPLRYMYDPAQDGASHSCWSDSTRNVDVHYSSGVGNHFFFLLAEGSGNTSWGYSPVCGSAPAVTGIGRSAAERIWFRALSVYFTSSTSYVNTSTPTNTARAYTLQAATDLFGRCSREYRSVQAAWTAVNVAGSDADCPTTTEIMGLLDLLLH